METYDTACISFTPRSDVEKDIKQQQKQGSIYFVNNNNIDITKTFFSPQITERKRSKRTNLFLNFEFYNISMNGLLFL